MSAVPSTAALKLPLRLLVVCPSWVGDTVMATPALRLLRESLPGCFIGGLVRPGIDQVLAGSDFFDELHVEQASGVMGPKFAAAKIRPRRYDTALLFTNSFSTALTTRIAGIPRRVGYGRDARGFLLTHRLDLPRKADGSRVVIPAVGQLLHAARAMLNMLAERTVVAEPVDPFAISPSARLQLFTSPAERSAGDTVLASLEPGTPFAILNPGGNNPAKRWPVERFAAIAKLLHHEHGLISLVNGSPAEAGLIAEIRAACTSPTSSLPQLGITLGSLKAILASGRCRLMITNDTGPRHIAAAFGVPVISLFGPTDHRWTTIPTGPGSGGPGGERIILADPTLPETEVSNDHAERCRIDRITVETVAAAADELLAKSGSRTNPETGQTRP